MLNFARSTSYSSNSHKSADIELTGNDARKSQQLIKTVKNVEIKEKVGGGQFSDVYKGLWLV